jgi:multiple sugar transport system permease protein
MLALVFMTPFVYMVSLSFQTAPQAMGFPPKLIPEPFTLTGYEKLFITSHTPVAKYARNSFVVAGLSTIGSVISCSMAGYALARIKFKGANIWFALILATTFIPAQVQLIPMYIMYSKMGWLDTLYPLIVPSFFGQAIGIFLLRQFFAGLPGELEDAATVDGANRWQQYWRIFMPLARPALATWAVLKFMESWNDLLGPLIFTTSRDLRTMTLAVAYMSNFYDASEWFVARMGMSLITILPLILLFIFAQKYFVQGIARSGLKG